MALKFIKTNPESKDGMAGGVLELLQMIFHSKPTIEGVLVFEIQPGIVRTDRIANVESVDEEKIAAGLLPQRRMSEVEDLAKAVRAIADGHLNYCVGQKLNVNGGFHIRTL